MEYDLETDTWTDLGVPITGGQTQYYTVGYYWFGKPHREIIPEYSEPTIRMILFLDWYDE